MSHLPDPRPAVSPLLTAALLLAARRHLSHLSLPHPTARQILDATGATHTRAYDLKNALLDNVGKKLLVYGTLLEEMEQMLEDAATDNGEREFVEDRIRHMRRFQERAQAAWNSPIVCAFMK